MANFHENLLAIAADDENMCRVLARMAMNLDANKQYTDFDIENIDGLDSARDIYYEVGPAVEFNYIFAFAGAPVPKEVAEGNTPGWSSPTSSEGGFILQLAAMVKATEKFNAGAPDGTSMSFSVTAPVARAMSDSASMGFTKYGENWVLTISYDTAWRPNSEDLDVFFMGLPKGNYGIAFFDADEYDGYESVSTCFGLHHGLAGMMTLDGGQDLELCNASEIKKQKREYAGVPKSGIDDLAELAHAAALGSWNQFGWSDEEEDDDYGYYNDGGESVNLWNSPPVNWRKPTTGDVKKITDAALDVLAALPLVFDVYYDFTSEGNEAAEGLMPGDAVVVSGEWNKTDFNSLTVLAVTGERLGRIGGWLSIVDNYEVNRIAPGVLALLLPHVRATVAELTPMSLRNKGVDGPKLSIRLDLLVIDDFTAVLEEVRESLNKDCSERGLASSVEEAM